MIRTVLFGAVIFLVATFPATWLLMLSSETFTFTWATGECFH